MTKALPEVSPLAKVRVKRTATTPVGDIVERSRGACDMLYLLVNITLLSGVFLYPPHYKKALSTVMKTASNKQKWAREGSPYLQPVVI